jgi:hypothetical protein
MMKTTKYILILLVVTLQTIQAQDESEIKHSNYTPSKLLEKEN